MIQGPKPKTDEWEALRFYDPAREDRPIIFGASDAPAACNVSPYSSAFQLCLEKTRQINLPFDPDQVERMEAGLVIEDAIVELYRRRRNCEVRRDLPMFFHSSLNYMSATPDGEAYTADEETVTWGVESKNTQFRMFDASGEDENKFGEEGTDAVPLQYLFQAQQQMEVMGWSSVDIPALFDGWKLRVYTVDRSDELIASITDAEKELAERVCNGELPEPHWRHARTEKVLKSVYGVVPKKKVVRGDDLRGWWLKREEIKLKIDELTADLSEATSRIIAGFEDAEIMTFEGSTIRIKRTVIADSLFTQQDVDNAKLKADEIAGKIGTVKRKGHSRLRRLTS